MNEIMNSVFEPADYNVVVVDFWADWCMPCKMLLPILEKLSAEFPSIVILKANIEENTELAKKYSITGIPTMLVFKDGNMAQKLVGLQRENSLRETFQKFLS